MSPNAAINTKGVQVMSHTTMTCENHPHLRWSCKEQAISYDKDGNGRYNGSRNIFFKGQYAPEVEGYSWDNCHKIVRGVLIQECACKSNLLILLPTAQGNQEEGLVPATATA
jgi:hypothetical protein